VLQTRRNWPEDSERRVLGPSLVNPERNGGTEDDDESVTETRQEKGSSPEPRVPVSSPSETPLEGVEDDQTSHADCSIFSSVVQLLESVDDDLVGLSSSIEPFVDTEQSGDLTGGNW
jgi:hypothetical protein